MNPSEIREMSEEERSAYLRDISQELFRLRLKRTTGQLDNPSRIRVIKRDIARIHTIDGELERRNQKANQ